MCLLVIWKVSYSHNVFWKLISPDEHVIKYIVPWYLKFELTVSAFWKRINELYLDMKYSVYVKPNLIILTLLIYLVMFYIPSTKVKVHQKKRVYWCAYEKANFWKSNCCWFRGYVLWFKIDQCIFNNEEDLHIGAVYVPPSKSKFYSSNQMPLYMVEIINIRIFYYMWLAI